MKEIKFRAWDKKTKTLRDVLVIDWLNLLVDLAGRTIIEREFNEVVLMQYTGLTDKNGKEIYEGDVVTSQFYPFQDEGRYNYHGVIEWDDEYACYIVVKRLVNSDKRGISDGVADNYDTIYEFEVIGNIYKIQSY